MSRAGRSGPTNGAPLDEAGLQALAVHYLGRYATTRARLASYLRRKLAERGWAGEGEAPVEAVVARCGALGYVDDASFALQRGAALVRRGYGARRVAAALRAAGVATAEAAPAGALADEQALEAALEFARRRRIGPFAARERDEQERRRDFAAMMRAGHASGVSRRVARSRPGEMPEEG